MIEKDPPPFPVAASPSATQAYLEKVKVAREKLERMGVHGPRAVYASLPVGCKLVSVA